MNLFSTTRTAIRKFTDQDYPTLVQLMSDPEVMRFTGFQTPQPPERVQELLKKWSSQQDTGLGVWAAVEKETQDFVAWYMLKRTHDTDPELGFMLPQSKWNQGYATEISQGFLDYGFKTLGLTKILASVVTENAASHRVLQKLDFCLDQEKSTYELRVYFKKPQ